MANSRSRPNGIQNNSQPAGELPQSFRETLTLDPLFAKLDMWRFQAVRRGATSPHTYRVFSTGRDFFVKEVTPNEKYTLQLLHRTGLRIAPVVYSTMLLEKGCLVTDFIQGDRLASKHLQPTLVRDVAQTQNVLNDRSLFENSPTPSGCKYTDRDDGFYRQMLVRNFYLGRQNLAVLSEAYHQPVVNQFQRVADKIGKKLELLVDEYARMPFAWLHNDFREDNILGDPQCLVDWGSSYGHGPFLVDLAPFIVDDPAAFRLFAQESAIGKSATGRSLKRWLMAALGARFVEFIRFRIDLEGGNWDTQEACNSFLEYEFAPFRHLLEYQF